jgi:hypothetical protein
VTREARVSGGLETPGQQWAPGSRRFATERTQKTEWPATAESLVWHEAAMARAQWTLVEAA